MVRVIHGVMLMMVAMAMAIASYLPVLKKVCEGVVGWQTEWVELLCSSGGSFITSSSSSILSFFSSSFFLSDDDSHMHRRR